MSEEDTTQETETTDEAVEETTETESTETESREGDEQGDESTFDASRALAKIKKANSEAKSQRERAKAAEEKVKGLEPAKREAALQRVARRLSLPDNAEVDEFLDRLKGETVDELAEDAERLLSLIAPKKGNAPAGKPKERLRGGGDPETEPPVDTKKLADDIMSGGL